MNEIQILDITGPTLLREELKKKWLNLGKIPNKGGGGVDPIPNLLTYFLNMLKILKNA